MISDFTNMTCKSFDDYEDECLDDQIRLSACERRKICDFEDFQVIDAEIIDYGICEEEYEQTLLISKTPPRLPTQPSVPSCVLSNNNKAKCVCIKVVDCYKYPGYYANYKRQILEMKYFNAYNTKQETDIAKCHDNESSISPNGDRSKHYHIAENHMKKDSPVKEDTVLSCKITSNIEKPRYIKNQSIEETNMAERRDSDKFKEDMKIKKIRQSSLPVIDFKKNKGLVGMKIQKMVVDDKTKEIIGKKVKSNKQKYNVTEQNNKNMKKSFIKTIDLTIENVCAPVTPVETQKNINAQTVGDKNRQIEKVVPFSKEISLKMALHKVFEDTKKMKPIKYKEYIKKQLQYTMNGNIGNKDGLKSGEYIINHKTPKINHTEFTSSISGWCKDSEKCSTEKNYHNKKVTQYKPMPKSKRIEMEKQRSLIDKNIKNDENLPNLNMIKKNSSTIDPTNTSSTTKCNINIDRIEKEKQKSLIHMNIKNVENLLKLNMVKKNSSPINPTNTSPTTKHNTITDFKAKSATKPKTNNTNLTASNKSSISVSKLTHKMSNPTNVNEGFTEISTLTNVSAKPPLEEQTKFESNKAIAATKPPELLEALKHTNLNTIGSKNKLSSRDLINIENKNKLMTLNPKMTYNSKLNVQNTPSNTIINTETNSKVVDQKIRIKQNTSHASNSPISDTSNEFSNIHTKPPHSLSNQPQEAQKDVKRKQSIKIKSVGNIENYIQVKGITKASVQPMVLKSPQEPFKSQLAKSNTIEDDMKRNQIDAAIVPLSLIPQESAKTKQDASSTQIIITEKNQQNGNNIGVEHTSNITTNINSNIAQNTPKMPAVMTRPSQTPNTAVLTSVAASIPSNNLNNLKTYIPRPPVLLPPFPNTPQIVRHQLPVKTVRPMRPVMYQQPDCAHPVMHGGSQRMPINNGNIHQRGINYMQNNCLQQLFYRRENRGTANMPSRVSDVLYKNYYLPYNYNFPPPPIPPPPPYRLDTSVRIDSSSSLVIDRNTNRFVEKTNISPSINLPNNEIDSKEGIVKKGIIDDRATTSSITVDTSPVLSKTEMLKILESSTIIESPVITVSKRPFLCDQGENQAAPEGNSRPGPLSKKLKLDTTTTPPRNRKQTLPHPGYSPPILPIPTYENFLSKVQPRLFEKPLDVPNPIVDNIYSVKNNTLQKQSRMGRPPKQAENYSYKKISLKDYIKRSRRTEDTARQEDINKGILCSTNNNLSKPKCMF